MRPISIVLIVLIALAACALDSPAQITLINSATGGPASATTSGAGHSLDSVVFQIGSASLLRSSLAASVHLPTAAALDPLSTGTGGPAAAPGFTIQWWYKVSAPTTFGYLWGELAWTSFRCFQNGAAGVEEVIIRGPLTDCTTTGAVLRTAVNAQGWIHLAVVVDTKANLTTWYVNGVKNNSAAAGITGKGTNFRCFGYDGSTGTGVAHNEDDFRIYNWARTAADVKADYMVAASGNGPSGSPNVPDLGYYKGDPPTSLVASGTAQPGTVVTLALTATNSPALQYQLGSSLGLGPIAIGTRSLGLAPDNLLVVSVGGFLPGVFANYAGWMDKQGVAKAAINLLKDARLVGIQIHTAFITLDAASPLGIKDISNTASFKIAP